MIPALMRQRQADLWKIKASLEFQDSQDYTEKPCLKKQKNKIKWILKQSQKLI